MTVVGGIGLSPHFHLHPRIYLSILLRFPRKREKEKEPCTTAQTPLPVLCCPFANAKMKGKGEGADCSQPGPSSLPSTPLPGPPAHIIEVDLIGGSPWGGCGEKAGSEQGRAVLGWGHGGQGTEMPRAEEAAGSGGELTPMGAVTAQVHVSHGDTVTCGTGGCSSTSNTEKGLGCPWSLPCATPVPATHRGSSG